MMPYVHLWSILLMIAFLHNRLAASNLNYMLSLKDSKIQEIVDKHNELRRNVTPTASNMRKMTWDPELESAAYSYAKKCIFAHSSSLNTSNFNVLGENLYAGSKYSFRHLLNNAIQDWYDEVKDFNYSSNTCATGKICGHFTQVVWANTYKVGCAVANCWSITYGTSGFLFSCNYGPGGNIVLVYPNGTRKREWPYLQGTPCSACGDSDLCENNLCNNTLRDTEPETTTTASISVTSTTTSMAPPASPTTTNSQNLSPTQTSTQITFASNSTSNFSVGTSSPANGTIAFTNNSINSTEGNGCPLVMKASTKTLQLLLAIAHLPLLIVLY